MWKPPQHSYADVVVPTIFISYSDRDAAARHELTRHLRLLERGGVLRIWNASDIEAGANWAVEIQSKAHEVDSHPGITGCTRV